MFKKLFFVFDYGILLFPQKTSEKITILRKGQSYGVTNFWGFIEISVSKAYQVNKKFKKKCVDTRENFFKMCCDVKQNV